MSRASEDAESSTPERLDFTVIDEAVHVLETPAEPWTIQLEVRLAGRLDEARLREAVQQAGARHPMARVRSVPARQTAHTWQWEVPAGLDVDPLRVVDDADDAALGSVRDDVYSRPVPLVESPPFRLVLVHRTGGEAAGDVLLLNANHAAFDGYGCVRLLQSVARAYTGEEDPEPAVPLDEARDVLKLLEAPDRATRRRRLRMMASKAFDLVSGITRMATDAGRDQPGYGLHHVALSKEDTERLTEREDATVNDVLLTALHLAIAAWNEEHGSRSRRIGTLVPVNLRPNEWKEDVVTNLVLDARVLTTAKDLADPAATLRAVRAQGEAIKKGGGAALIEVIGGWTALPLWMKQPVSALLSVTGARLVCTALLSNLGPLKAPPDFGPDAGEVTEAWFSAPTRMPCGLVVGAATLDGRLHLVFRYRHPMLDRHATERFAKQFVVELERVAGVN